MSPNFVESWLLRISELPAGWLFLFTVFSNFFENVFPPWPGDTVTVFLGYLASRASSVFFTGSLFFANLIGNWIGAFTMFFFGQRILGVLASSRFQLISRLSDSQKLDLAKAWFAKRSFFVVSVSRFSAGLRFFVAIVAGMSGMPVILFFFSYTLGVLVWSGFLFFGGYAFGKNWESILPLLANYQRVVIALMILGGSAFFFMMHRRKTREGG